jgi:hypothetical protein
MLNGWINEVNGVPIAARNAIIPVARVAHERNSSSNVIQVSTFSLRNALRWGGNYVQSVRATETIGIL